MIVFFFGSLIRNHLKIIYIINLRTKNRIVLFDEDTNKAIGVDPYYIQFFKLMSGGEQLHTRFDRDL